MNCRPMDDLADCPTAMYERIWAVVQQNTDFVVTTHIRVDGDALGCTIAIAEVLKAMGKKVRIVNNSPIPEQYRFMTVPGEILASAGPVPEVVVALDCSNLERLAMKLEDVPGALVVDIDHHPTNTRFGAINWIDAEAPCVGEMLFSFFTAMGAPIPRRALDSLYISLLTDTGRFSFANTSCRALDAASLMCRAGVDPGELAACTYFSLSPEKLEFLGIAYTNVRYAMGQRIAWLSITERQLRDHGLEPEDTQELVDIPRLSLPSELAVFFLGLGNGEVSYTRVSLRSKTDFDCSRLADVFGGGGHKASSGAVIRLPLHQAVEAVLGRAEVMLAEHGRASGDPA